MANGAPTLNAYLLDEDRFQRDLDVAASVSLHDQWSHDPVLYARRINAVHAGTIDHWSMLDPYRALTRIQAAFL